MKINSRQGVFFLFLSSVTLRNFRNYRELNVDWHPRLNLISGANAQGKSNLLEALGYLSVPSSFRTARDLDLIRWNQPFFAVTGTITKKQGEFDLYTAFSHEPKKILKINGTIKKKVSDYLGFLHSVVFSPDDLKIVQAGPAARRKYLDGEMIQIFPAYFQLLIQYQKILSQRNNLLKEIRYYREKEELITVWDHQLAVVGSKIIKKRIEVLKKLTPLARLMQRKITDGDEGLEIIYESIDRGDILKKMDLPEIERLFLDKIQNMRKYELERRISLVGPHRDDLVFLVNDIDVRKFGSQGQQRTTALSLKMAELELMKGETGEYPILLLDDVMSELDEKRCSHLLDLVGNKVQTFITATECELKGHDYQKLVISHGTVKIS